MEYAFGNKADLDIYIPASVKSIYYNAFVYDIGDPDYKSIITIYCNKGSYAESFATAYGYKYKYTDILSAVISLKAISVDRNKVKLTWKVAQGAEGYLIYGQKNGKYGYVGMTKNNTFVDIKAYTKSYNFYCDIHTI